jgi:hypothetical protein
MVVRNSLEQGNLIPKRVKLNESQLNCGRMKVGIVDDAKSTFAQGAGEVSWRHQKRSFVGQQEHRGVDSIDIQDNYHL